MVVADVTQQRAMAQARVLFSRVKIPNASNSLWIEDSASSVEAFKRTHPSILIPLYILWTSDTTPTPSWPRDISNERTKAIKNPTLYYDCTVDPRETLLKTQHAFSSNVSHAQYNAVRPAERQEPLSSGGKTRPCAFS